MSRKIEMYSLIFLKYSPLNLIFSKKSITFQNKNFEKKYYLILMEEKINAYT